MIKQAATFADLLAQAGTFGATDYLVFPDRRIHFGEMAQRANTWAKGLIKLGIQRNDNVGVLLPNCPEFVELLLAITSIGAVIVPFNPRYQPGELAFAIENADIVALITTDELSDIVDFSGRITLALPSLAGQTNPHALALAEAPHLRQVIAIKGGSRAPFLTDQQVIAESETVSTEQLKQRQQAIKPDDIALMFYTSGTTAKPKGCLVSHQAILSNSRNIAYRYHIDAKDTLWCPLPIFHIAGILPVLIGLQTGIKVCLLRKFDGVDALALLENEKATCGFPSYVTILQDIVAAPRFAVADLSHVRLLNSNPAMQPGPLRDALEQKMPGMSQLGTYGLTEGGGAICGHRPEDPAEILKSGLGTPFDSWEVEIRNMETGAACATGAQGEICFRGPGMISGYYKSPEKQAETIDVEGWLHSGDIGSFDHHGQLMFHGRLKDMLKVGGENVAAAEIEEIINQHPAVKLAQVVAAPHPRYQEVPVAFIELAPGQGINEAELIDFCRGKIANFKLPRAMRLIEAWPMSTSKIQKFKLREMVSNLDFER